MSRSYYSGNNNYSPSGPRSLFAHLDRNARAFQEIEHDIDRSHTVHMNRELANVAELGRNYQMRDNPDSLFARSGMHRSGGHRSADENELEMAVRRHLLGQGGIQICINDDGGAHLHLHTRPIHAPSSRQPLVSDAPHHQPYGFGAYGRPQNGLFGGESRLAPGRAIPHGSFSGTDGSGLFNRTAGLGDAAYQHTTADAIMAALERISPSAPHDQSTRSGLFNSQGHGAPTQPVRRGAGDWTEEAMFAARRERWAYEIQQELQSLLRQVTRPENTSGTPLPGRVLPSGRRMPSNLEVAPYYLSTPQGEAELEDALRSYLPNRLPDGALVIVHPPNQHNGHVRVIQFECANAPRFDRSRTFMDSFTSEALLTLINRTGFVPRLYLNTLIWPTVTRQGPPSGVSESTMGGLQTRQVVQADLDDEGKVSCGICLEEKCVGETVTALPCHHFFDKDCVETWLRENGTCPTCRGAVE